MERESDRIEEPPRAPAEAAARKTALHRMAVTAAMLAVMLFALWRCG
jgi:hypothetical protein